jgi:D-tyrosyl-tRNA(Tyr) deacylase
VQRVSRAEVRVAGECVGRIDSGLCVFLGAGVGDQESDADALADKIVHLRVFEDERGQMNRELAEIGGALLAISQFTLYGDCRRGRRPCFTEAMAPGPAEELFERFVARARAAGARVETGRFRAHMEIDLLNHGPVTLLLDSRKGF